MRSWKSWACLGCHRRGDPHASRQARRSCGDLAVGHGEEVGEDVAEKRCGHYGKRYVLRLPLTASNKAPPTPSNAHVAGSGTVTSASGEKRMLSREK